MKSYNRIFIGIIILIVFIFFGTNWILFYGFHMEDGRPYRVEINRICFEIENNGYDGIEVSQYKYVTNVEKYSEANLEFYSGESDYLVREINGEIYRFDYKFIDKVDKKTVIMVNMVISIMAAVLIAVVIFIRRRILQPFDYLKEVPFELSKGNLTMPIKESKNRFFGRFIWGVDLLRENMEQQKQCELNLQKEKKTLLLSISHDIKTPLSAIKLYAKALSKGLYDEKNKQLQIAENINAKADEIENFITQIISASREDFLKLEVTVDEFYLSALIEKISAYYKEKLDFMKINFFVGDYCDCILQGDFDRSVEVIQNIMENAVKYGDGHLISIKFCEEDGCQLLTIENSGCALPERELPYVFDSFWRGSNVGNWGGSGLGLYICRQLMNKMGGEVFAEIKGGFMMVTAVFVKV